MERNNRRNRNNHINILRSPTIVLAGLLASTLALPTPVSAQHGREGRDREKMSSLLQSLFEMKNSRSATQTPASPQQLSRAASPLGTWSGPSSSSKTAAGEESAAAGAQLSHESLLPSLFHIPPLPSRVEAPLSHESPPSPPYHLGLLRVSGAAAAKLPAPAIRSLEGGAAGQRRPHHHASLAMLHGGEDPSLDDGAEPRERHHDFVRDLRRQFELRQQRAHADE